MHTKPKHRPILILAEARMMRAATMRIDEGRNREIGRSTGTVPCRDPRISSELAREVLAKLLRD